jgi:hypothetical protein
MDADEEERARGVTMDVGTSFFETKTKHVTLLDAPGHRDFIPKMIAGASQADVAVLVVPAVTGEFEAAFENSGQTKEHTLLVRSLGVTQLVVAVNKMDAVAWSKERFDGIVASLTSFLAQSGFRLKNLWFVPVSGMTGVNLQTRLDATHTEGAWYSGPTLVESIDQFAPPQREISEPFRMTESMSLGQTLSGRVYAGRGCRCRRFSTWRRVVLRAFMRCASPSDCVAVSLAPSTWSTRATYSGGRRNASGLRQHGDCCHGTACSCHAGLSYYGGQLTCLVGADGESSWGGSDRCPSICRVVTEWLPSLIVRRLVAPAVAVGAGGRDS